MRGNSGAYWVARGIWTDPEFPEERFSEREAWLWFVGAAMWREGSVKTFAGTMTLDHGELCFSERFLAKKWNWSKSRVNRVLDRWEKKGWIDGVTVNEKRGTNRGTERGSRHRSVRVYSVRNYNKNQPNGQPQQDASGAVVGASVFKNRGKEEEVITEYINGEPQAAPLDGLQKKWVWTEGVAKLQSLNTGEPQARKLIGRWLSAKSEPVATEDMLRRAILAAETAGTADPVPFITAILKNEAAGSVHRDGDEWIIPHGTEEYAAHAKHARIGNSPDIYRWPDTPGHVARAKSRWPNSAEIVNLRQEARA
jgi:hypothetical protein